MTITHSYKEFKDRYDKTLTSLAEEDIGEECFIDADEYEFKLSRRISGLYHSTGRSQIPRVIVEWVENGEVVSKLLMRKRQRRTGGRGSPQIYSPAPKYGIKRTDEGWMECWGQGEMYFFRNGEFINGHFLGDYKVN